LSLLQTDSGIHPASYSECTGGLSLEVQQSVCETDNSPTSRMSRAVFPHPIYAFIACAGTLLLFYSYVNKILCLILVRTSTTKYLSFLIHEISTNFFMPTDIIVGSQHLSEYTTLQTFLPAFHLVQQKLPCSCFANLLCTAMASPHVICMQKCCSVTENNARLRTKHKICSKHLPHNHPRVNSTSPMFLV